MLNKEGRILHSKCPMIMVDILFGQEYNNFLLKILQERLGVPLNRDCQIKLKEVVDRVNKVYEHKH